MEGQPRCVRNTEAALVRLSFLTAGQKKFKKVQTVEAGQLC